MKIHEIIYVPTLRCNLRCAHCGQNRVCDEIDCNIIKNRLKAIPIENAPKLYITGGEPFLKSGIVEFIADLANEGWHIYITTNGSCTDKIEQLLSLITKKVNIGFTISIDGLEKTHNAIRRNENSYELACKSLKMISQHGISVGVGTVVQGSNIDQLSEMDKEITEYVGVQIPRSCIPVVSDISCDKTFVFTDEQIMKIFPILERDQNKKYIMSGNTLKIEDCHAGISTCMISPDGKVYTCLTGFSYFDDEERKNYLMGDLRTESLENIYAQQSVLNKSWYQAVKSCKGCSNPCELTREELYYEFNAELSESEKERLKKLWQHNNSEVKAIFLSGWHANEEDDGGAHRWMNNRHAQLLFKIGKEGSKKLNITYGNSIDEKLTKEPMTLSLKLNNKVAVHNLILKNHDTIELLLDGIYKKNDVLELDFLINQVWRPCDILRTTDNRTLGISIVSVEAY